MRRAVLVAAVLLAVVGVGCGSGAEPPTGAGEADEAAPAPTGSEAASSTTAPAGDGEGDDPTGALDFVVPALDGGTVRGADYAGGDVVLWMWAPW